VQDLVTDPEVAVAIVESDFVHVPPSTKDARAVSGILLDQQWNAVV